VIPKLGILRQDEHGVSLAVIPVFTVPTESETSDYFGDDGWSFSPEVVLGRRWGGLRGAIEAGYRARKNARLANLRVADELFARIGLGYQVSDPAEIGITTSGATAAADVFDRFNSNHLESFLGLSYRVAPVAILFGGGGVGWENGFGTPDWRVLAGVRFGAPERDQSEPTPRPVDSDGDGLLDTADACPHDPEDADGFEDENGCPDPDNDKDGVLDGDDACRDHPGLAAFKGCPDTDGDGITDAADACATEPEDKDGFEDENGCPDPDNDKDGVLDASDSCPLEPGTVENKGCPDPDRDGDTVVDRLDNCPDEPGDREHNGCKKPQLVTITNNTLVIMESVYFQLDKAVILKKSYPLLDNVAAVLASHPDLVVQVEGHTDSLGNDKYNKDLSQRRADAVVAYLVKKKIGRDRLKAVGFGEEHPIADNTTKEGRAQNRRVVFTILSGGQNVQTREQGADDATKEK
jgi:outer membrane protein OmpA-like peptidoglycan-associated protein